jgi:hypothetical protein
MVWPMSVWSHSMESAIFHSVIPGESSESSMSSPSPISIDHPGLSSRPLCHDSESLFQAGSEKYQNSPDQSNSRAQNCEVEEKKKGFPRLFPAFTFDCEGMIGRFSIRFSLSGEV